jgi:hypothetical protein
MSGRLRSSRVPHRWAFVIGGGESALSLPKACPEPVEGGLLAPEPRDSSPAKVTRTRMVHSACCR